jgi:hypothetical protein
MVLRFGNGTETPFLTEQECEREKQAVEQDLSQLLQENNRQKFELIFFYSVNAASSSSLSK